MSDQSTVETMSAKFTTELRDLRDLQAAVDKRRNDERAAEEAEKKATREKAAAKQEGLLEQLLTAQVSEAQERAKKQSTVNKLLAALLTLATTGGGAGIYLASQKPTDDEKAEQAKPLTDVVEKQSKEIETRVEKNAKKIGRLGEIAIEQQVQLSDDGEYTRDLIRAAHSRQRSSLAAVDVPPSVTDAKTKSTKIKKAKKAAGTDSAARDADPLDPFAGL